MNQLASLPVPASALPALIASADDRAQLRFMEFFAVTIQNPHTRRTYARACGELLDWCLGHGVASICRRLNDQRFPIVRLLQHILQLAWIAAGRGDLQLAHQRIKEIDLDRLGIDRGDNQSGVILRHADNVRDQAPAAGHVVEDARLAALDPQLIDYVQISGGPPAMPAPDAADIDEAMNERRIPNQGEMPLVEMLRSIRPEVVVSGEVPLRSMREPAICCLDRAKRVVAGIAYVPDAAGRASTSRYRLPRRLLQDSRSSPSQYPRLSSRQTVNN